MLLFWIPAFQDLFVTSVTFAASYSQAVPGQAVEKQDRGVQKYDLEELMVQFNYIVKTSHLPGK